MLRQPFPAERFTFAERHGFHSRAFQSQREPTDARKQVQHLQRFFRAVHARPFARGTGHTVARR
jgi:hypothetical protein